MSKFKKVLTLDLMVDFTVPDGWVHGRKQYSVYEGSNIRLETSYPDGFPSPIHFGPCPFLDALTKPAKKKSKKKKKS